MAQRLFVALLLLALPGQPQDLAPTPRSSPPRLLVILVVDQMRADYVQQYGDQWTRGLRRLYDTSARFPLAAYPYAVTVTCAGHATIGTGQFPSHHGMIGNGWHDRDVPKNVTCTEDPTVTSVPFGGRTGRERHGPKYLGANTLTDELRLRQPEPPIVVGLSLKARSALTLAGHPSPTTYAVWEENDGTWASSTAYTDTAWPAVDDWVRANPIDKAYGTEWTRLLPESRYRFDDRQPGEPDAGTFPHRLISQSGKPDTAFAGVWERSPFSDAALGSLAAHLVGQLKMGQVAGRTDVLAVGFSALDLVGHAFGPRSHEVQDTLVRLDATIGDLLTTLDAVVGPDHYVVALSADHGVAPVPEQAAGIVRSSGRFTWNAVRAAIESALAPLLGEGPHVTTVSGANVYLTPGTLERVGRTPGAREAVDQALARVEGLGAVYWTDELSDRAAAADPGLQLARNSWVAGRSGDLMVMYDQFWIGQSTGTTHGSPYDYDRRVPVLFAGPGIVPGERWTAASPVDIAPTLAQIAGVTLARTDGRVLGEIFR